MSKTIRITEATPSDISTVIGYLANPTEIYPNGQVKKCDTWSVFNNEYAYGKERDFIAEIDAANPEKYSAFHISWSNCN